MEVKGLTLYAICAEMQEVVERMESFTKLEDGRLLDEETGEVMEASILDDLQLAQDEKVKNCLYVIKNLDYDAAALKAKKDYLKGLLDAVSAQITAVEKKQEWLKSYVGGCLDYRPYKADDKTISCYARNVESVEVDDVDKLPEEFVKVTVYKNADKIALKKAIKDGMNFEGARLQTRKSLIVKG